MRVQIDADTVGGCDNSWKSSSDCFNFLSKPLAESEKGPGRRY